MDMGTEDLHNYDPLCNNILVNKKYIEQMIPICKKYLRFIDTSKTWKSPFNGFDISILLNFWLYDKLKHIYRDAINNEIDVGFSALQLICDKLANSRSEGSYYKKYSPDWDMVNHTDWEYRKKLYDYSVDYQELSFRAKHHDDKCKYYKQIQEKQEIFNHFDEFCKSNEDKCPKFYRECSMYNPKYVLPTSECQKEMEQSNDLSTESNSSEKGDISGLPAAPITKHPARGDDPDLSQTTSPSQKAESRPQISGIVTKVSDSVLGAAPVLLTATVLYRYTPLGPWIRRLGGGRTNSMNTMDTFSPYIQETGYRFSEDPVNYISYQPI
ncbi:hypothetical protein PVBG_05741 [Plasmodium vivax Brazil I]|uniref:Variable surface protein Vir4 n=1 Tax=Plasmodium vivax (strain Brazil I) TaxID=1033975 RepID=A0A0J9SK05_PLAV1|nr:hypothetical protein PVBG_05741 [Plasmodium vivax Brazil I]